jgi:GH15 family glucan-1,4-alpha-glucosidase
VLAETFPHAVLLDDGYGPVIQARFRMQPGQAVPLVSRWNTADAAFDVRGSEESLHGTARVWRRWTDKEGLADMRDRVVGDGKALLRSELALKLLTHGETGAIAAAATTSLPEEIGGIRNWDYRFAWIRDAGMLVESFSALGHVKEITDFLRFVKRSASRRFGRASVRIMYGMRGESSCPEETLPHLDGYRQSRPVRVGNEGFAQVQHDAYGQILNAAYEYVRIGASLSPDMRTFLPRVADQACRQWRDPDYGIWEMRGPPRHYVYSKVMVWVALDRALALAERGVIDGDVARWRREREVLHAEVLHHGYSPEAGAFVLAYGSRDLDGANLMLPMLEFLPFDDDRVRGTINRTIETLVTNGFVYRYRADDGLPGDEGAFTPTSFWLADALAFSGRLDEAHQYFETMVSHANHVGLFTEEIDPRTREALGNFPQALTHLSHIDSVIHLSHAEGRDLPIAPPIGSVAHRAERGRA